MSSDFEFAVNVGSKCSVTNIFDYFKSNSYFESSGFTNNGDCLLNECVINHCKRGSKSDVSERTTITPVIKGWDRADRLGAV